MKKRVVRSVKYFVKLVLLLAAIYGLLFLTGTSRISAEAFFPEVFSTYRGWAMIAALVLLAALYPSFGFVRRTVRADFVQDRENILKAFAADGYTAVSVTGQRMVMRAASPVRRLTSMYDDTVTVIPGGEGIVIEGIRKEAVRAEFRLKTYLENEKAHDD